MSIENSSLDLSYDPVGDELHDPLISPTLSLYTVNSAGSPISPGIGENVCLEDDVFEDEEEEDEVNEANKSSSSGDSTKTVVSFPDKYSFTRLSICYPETMAPTVNHPKYVNLYRKCLMKWEDSYEDLDIKKVPSTRYDKMITELQSMIGQLQDVQIHFIENPYDQFPQADLDRIVTLRKAASSLVKRMYEELQDEEDAADDQQNAPINMAAAAVAAIEPMITSQTMQAVADFKAVQVVSATTPAEFRSLQSMFDDADAYTEDLLKQIEGLRTEAATAQDQANQAKAVDAANSIRENRKIAASHVKAVQSSLGIVAGQNPSVSLNITLPVPKFSGSYSDPMDFFTFEKKITEYFEVTGAASDQYKILKLKNECLKEPAATAVKEFEVFDAAMDKLRELYGQPRILFNLREADIRKLGKCPDACLERRTWMIDLKSKLTALFGLQEKMNIQSRVEASDIVELIETNMRYYDLNKFMTHLYDIQQADENFDIDDKSNRLMHLGDYLDELIEKATFEVNFKLARGGKSSADVISKTAKKSEPAASSTKKSYAAKPTSSANTPQSTPQASKVKSRAYVSVSKPVPLPCKPCEKKHTTLGYCPAYRKARIKDRFRMCCATKGCPRCLRMDGQFNFKERAKWYEDHKQDCDDRFVCKRGECANRAPHEQNHFTMCLKHFKENREDMQHDYIATLDKKYLPENVRFFFTETAAMKTKADTAGAATIASVEAAVARLRADDPDVEIVEDTTDKAVYMMQQIPGPRGEKLLVFFDSGCFGAGMSERAYSILDTVCMRQGPTAMDVAGGKVVHLKHGDELFYLPLVPINKKNRVAAITALRMEDITADFPVWRLHLAWTHLNMAYKKNFPNGPPLPEVEYELGGCPVDLMLGSKYLKLFPIPLFVLPSGLTISRSIIKGYSGKQGVIAGPFSAWGPALDAMNHFNLASYFTAEFRAYRYHTMTLFSRFAVEAETDKVDTAPLDVCVDDSEAECGFRRTILQAAATSNSISKQVRDLMRWDSLGADVEYRCGRCRVCVQCKNSDALEKVSLQEETEQAMIENCISYDPNRRKIVAKLPFILEPKTHLAENYYVAAKVLESQIRMVEKQPELRPQLQASHAKLADRGYVCKLDDLPLAEKKLAAEAGYFLPWRHVHSGSLSTPCRLVFDASARTKSGYSLNCTLAKGSNQLATLLHLLIKFRIGGAAFTADVSMAYNAILIEPEYYKYQKYLWNETLSPGGEVLIMVILTLIYGVRPSGNLTIEGFRKTAEVAALDETLNASGGPECLRDRMYLDDTLAAYLATVLRDAAAASFEKTLDTSQMAVKAITKSGFRPDEKVSTDGIHVSVVGYLWDPFLDVLKLDIKPLYFGKAKRGKLPSPVQGEVEPELRKHFTRRNLAGKVAGIFDPLGLAVPVTAKLKIDLSIIVRETASWDEPVNEKFLPIWLQNLNTIQDLAKIAVPRSVISLAFEVGQDVELIISTDASQLIAVAAVYVRWREPGGQYSCQLIAARSKLISKLTIPRAELRACAMGACLGEVVRKNCGNLVSRMIYVSDSTVALSWIQCDQRPLQVGVRNQVIQIRRFSDPAAWFHVPTDSNPADIGTRSPTVEEIAADSEWHRGKPWMRGNFDAMPIKPVTDITLTPKDKVEIKSEVRASDVQGICLTVNLDETAQRYLFSQYLIDPCAMPWTKYLKRMAVVCKVAHILKEKSDHFPQFESKPLPALHEDDYKRAERYIFKRTTAEVKKFVPPNKLPDHRVDDDGVIVFVGRVLDGEGPTNPLGILLDVTPGYFIKPIVDRFSPVAYSVMTHCHVTATNHGGAISSLRVSRTICYILSAKQLAVEIIKACYYCRRYRAKQIEAAMGPQSESRMCIAPAFYAAQVDLFGPITAHCAHGRRALVKNYAAVFKCPTTLAVTAFTMEDYSTESFLDAFVRFTARYGVPNRLFIDAGSQLLAACRNAEFSIDDITKTINGDMGVQLDFEVCPVARHEAHSAVERSIRQIKEVLQTLVTGIKMDSLKIETVLAWACNQINSLPLCIGNQYVDLDHLDLITPSRLLLGRNNHRALGGLPVVTNFDKIHEQNTAIEKAWWTIWEREKMTDLIPSPHKWKKGDPDVQKGDIVIFLKDKSMIGGGVWRIGEIDEVEKSRDGVIRVVSIRYRIPAEKVNRYTRRSVRSIAVLWREAELDLPGRLSAAQAAANLLFLRS